MKYIDIHTHNKNIVTNVVQVHNIILYEHKPIIDLDIQYLSAGIHPWYLTDGYLLSNMDLLEDIASHQNILAIGECGLDRTKKETFGLQREIFLYQVELSELHKKPLIIHCVKACSDILEMRKNSDAQMPWILHGFNEGKEMINQLLKYGFYFSVGHLIFDLKSAISQNIKLIPLDRLFLETDESEYQIQEIYLKVAELIQIDEKQVVNSVFSNFNKLFKKVLL